MNTYIDPTTKRSGFLKGLTADEREAFLAGAAFGVLCCIPVIVTLLLMLRYYKSISL